MTAQTTRGIEITTVLAVAREALDRGDHDTARRLVRRLLDHPGQEMSVKADTPPPDNGQRDRSTP